MIFVKLNQKLLTNMIYYAQDFHVKVGVILENKKDLMIKEEQCFHI